MNKFQCLIFKDGSVINLHNVKQIIARDDNSCIVMLMDGNIVQVNTSASEVLEKCAYAVDLPIRTLSKGPVDNE